jgi:hypothetical protein
MLLEGALVVLPVGAVVLLVLGLDGRIERAAARTRTGETIA